MRGLGGAAGSFADSMEKAQAAKAAEERSIELMNFNLMDAQRKERSGNVKGAMEATAKAEKNKLDAVAAERVALNAQGVIEARVAQSLRKPKGDGAGGDGAGKAGAVDRVTAQMQDQLIDLKNSPNPNAAQIKTLEDKIAGRMNIIAATKDSGPGKLSVANVANELKYKAMIEKAVSDLMVTGPFLSRSPARQKEMIAEVETRIRSQPLPQDDSDDNMAPPPPPGFKPRTKP
jgi:hypothetical protein